MNNHQIIELLKISMSSIKEIADVDMIVGSSVSLGDAVVKPICKVKYSFISGGLDQQAPKPYVDGDYPFGGGSGMIMQIQPIADCIEFLQKKLQEEKREELFFLPFNCFLFSCRFLCCAFLCGFLLCWRSCSAPIAVGTICAHFLKHFVNVWVTYFSHFSTSLFKSD